MFVTLQCDRYRRHKIIQSAPLECVTASIGVALLRMIGIIYKYTSPSGKVYIGQTIDEKKRRKEFRNLNIKYAGRKINHARKKYGPENFEYEVLERYRFRVMERARKKLNEREKYFIELYDSYRHGYNSDTGGWDASGFTWSEETKAEFRKKKKGKPNPFLGKHHTDETRAILSEKAKQSYANGRVPNFKGRHHTEEAKRKNSEAHKTLYANGAIPYMLGKHLPLAVRLILSIKAQERMADPIFKAKFDAICASEEHRKNLSEALKGEKNPMFGKNHTKEARAKMSKARKGVKNCNYAKTFSDETRRKLSESALRRKPMLQQSKEKLKINVGVAVCQYSISGEFIAEYPTAKIAAQAIGKESSCILKCCKGQRGVAYGFKWKYKDAPLLELDTLDRSTWIPISEAIELSGHKSVVLYYHMDVIKDIPYKQHGKRRYLHKPSILSIFRRAV